MSLQNDKIVLETAESDGVGDLTQRAQNRLILDNFENQAHNWIDANDGVDFSTGPTSFEDSIAIGRDAQTEDYNSVAIGSLSVARGRDSIAIGINSNVGDRGTNEQNDIAIGDSAQVTGNNAIGLGASCVADGIHAIAIGGAQATASSSVAIGRSVVNTIADSVRLGRDSSGTGVDNVLHLKDKGRLHLEGDNAAYNLPSYTVATVPTGSEGDMIYVTDGDAGSKCVAVFDGSNWKVVSLGATIST